MEFERFIEILFYGSYFGSYDSGVNIKEVVSEFHKDNFGVGFNDIGLDGYRV